jgi:hypothetical protein
VKKLGTLVASTAVTLKTIGAETEYVLSPFSFRKSCEW